MTSTERDIIVEIGSYWVCKTRDGYVVFCNGYGATHSISDGVAYPLNDDGLSLAVASCRYKATVEFREWFKLATECLADHRSGMFATYVGNGVAIWKALQ